MQNITKPQILHVFCRVATAPGAEGGETVAEGRAVGKRIGSGEAPRGNMTITFDLNYVFIHGIDMLR